MERRRRWGWSGKRLRANDGWQRGRGEVSGAHQALRAPHLRRAVGDGRARVWVCTAQLGVL